MSNLLDTLDLDRLPEFSVVRAKYEYTPDDVEMVLIKRDGSWIDSDPTSIATSWDAAELEQAELVSLPIGAEQ